MSEELEGMEKKKMTRSAIIFGFIALFYSPLVLMDSWNWFLVPLFEGAKHMTYGSAWGLEILIAVFKFGYKPEVEESEKIRFLEKAFPFLATVHFFGFISHMFIN